ncbi:hypothetical protein LAZ29_07615 [Cereibacter sphaeroides]|uniref:DUF6629 family protein n=1 Tax=Cereibacter sphaeroides TaxID=1063 RepID=UPI001F2F5C6C|nr:DUF6629 family protein [Cereibacter sphaeroides]MCE6950795.1 hypothetical protein [Cereibacter sphaeroides]
MCFSATASFGAGAVLVPLGILAMAQARKTDRRFLLLAAFPALFGYQQIFEGFLWQSLDGSGGFSRTAALAFLLFAYLLWPVLTPLAAFRVEDRPALRRIFLGLAVLGGLYGLSLYAPLLVRADWLGIGLARGSIVYESRLVYDGLVSTTVLRLVYAALICMPLLACTAHGVRFFGVLVTLSVVLGFLFATYAFTSIWCYLAAAVSGYLAVAMLRLPRRTDSRKPVT